MCEKFFYEINNDISETARMLKKVTTEGTNLGYYRPTIIK